MPLTHEDAMYHFVSGQCASRKVPGCSEVARTVVLASCSSISMFDDCKVQPRLGIDRAVWHSKFTFPW